jgi:hypothetical protein
MSKEKGPKRRPGKPLKDPSGKQRVISLGISPATEERLRQIGGGSVQDGLRRLIARAVTPSATPRT